MLLRGLDSICAACHNSVKNAPVVALNVALTMYGVGATGQGAGKRISWHREKQKEVKDV